MVLGPTSGKAIEGCKVVWIVGPSLKRELGLCEKLCLATFSLGFKNKLGKDVLTTYYRKCVCTVFLPRKREKGYKESIKK